MRRIILSITIVINILPVNTDIFAQDHKNVELAGRIHSQFDIIYNVVVIEDLAYVATQRFGLQIVDISNPENPEFSSYRDDNPGAANGLTVSGDYAYIADFRSGLRVISVADSEYPEEVRCFSLKLTKRSAMQIIQSKQNSYYYGR